MKNFLSNALKVEVNRYMFTLTNKASKLLQIDKDTPIMIYVNERKKHVFIQVEKPNCLEINSDEISILAKKRIDGRVFFYGKYLLEYFLNCNANPCESIFYLDMYIIPDDKGKFKFCNNKQLCNKK